MVAIWRMSAFRFAPGSRRLGVETSRREFVQSFMMGNVRCRLAIRAARFGLGADVTSRAGGEKQTVEKFLRQRKTEGALRAQ